MTTLIPNSQASGVEAYEDMFKEITKKLYGEEASQSLQTPMTHATADADRSFTNLLSDRNLPDFDHHGAGGIDNVGTLKSDEHLTAFGLAALMQNGFGAHTFQQMNKQNQLHPHANATATTANSLSGAGNLSTASAHTNTNETIQEKCASMQQQQQQQHGNELSAWNPKSETYQHSSKHYKSKKHEASNHHIANEHLKAANGLNNNNINNNGGNTNQTSNGNGGQSGLQKRYNCSSCPYSTDRRDLFTRHENIHKEDKPFHCYVCLKQFNRADHVKKHFLRMHRGLNYDIGRTKRTLPSQQQQQTKSKKPATTNAPYYNAANNTHATTNLNVTPTYQTSLQNQSHHQQMDVNAPTSCIDQTNPHLNNTFNHATTPPGTVSANSHNQLNIKVEKRLDNKPAKKSDKRFVCCYCSWSGNDNWGLKRHLNTHTKPFVCVLCDYKAARSERLATHVFKVHNKKVCTKCNYLAENQNEYDAHVNSTHANETRTQRTSQTESRSSPNNSLRNVHSSFSPGNSYNTLPATSSSSSSGHAFGHWRSMISGTGPTSPTVSKSNGNSSGTQKRGAERLFQYFEADDSDPEDYARQLQMAAISRNTASVAQDFHNAGGGKLMGAQNANKQLIKENIYANNHCASTAHDNVNLMSKCLTNKNNLDIIIVRQRISPPAKHMEHLIRSNYQTPVDRFNCENSVATLFKALMNLTKKFYIVQKVTSFII